MQQKKEEALHKFASEMCKNEMLSLFENSRKTFPSSSPSPLFVHSLIVFAFSVQKIASRFYFVIVQVDCKFCSVYSWRANGDDMQLRVARNRDRDRN